MYIHNLLFLFLIFIENLSIRITGVLFFYYLILTELWDTWDDVIGGIIKLGTELQRHPKSLFCPPLWEDLIFQ